MRPDPEQFLRSRISESFLKATERIDREVAQALLKSSQFQHDFGAEELAVVFANIFHTMIELQPFANLSVPVTHNVTETRVEIHHPGLCVSTVLHIHSPIRAFIEIEYDLLNGKTPGSIVLSRPSLRVKQKTGRLDVFAKTLLKAIDVRGLLDHELQDPMQVIRKTLPHRLKTYGFKGKIAVVHLQITPENRLHTILTTDGY